MKPLSNPILIVSDNPSLPGGLSRMGRDLATLCCTMPEFRVGYLGRGIGQNRRLPFLLYDFPESGQWGESYIQKAWEDFSAGDDGVIITLDDPSRRHWFVNPIGLPAQMQQFLGDGRSFKRWAYFPIDSVGPSGNSLSYALSDCVRRYDRVLAATEWAFGIIRQSGRTGDTDWLPHGIWMDKFHPIKDDRKLLDIKDNMVRVGCVMANQSRKDYPAAFECFHALKKHYGNRFTAWLHTDRMIHYWNVYALAADYGVTDCLEVTESLNDDQLALHYSACNCTILPTAGEGFGYPIVESQACGTPCITTDYAGGAELVPDNCRVPPVTFRVDTAHNVVRAVLSGHSFLPYVIREAEQKQDWEYRSEQVASNVSHLDWNKLRHLWERWLKKGLQ